MLALLLFVVVGAHVASGIPVQDETVGAAQNGQDSRKPFPFGTIDMERDDGGSITSVYCLGITDEQIDSLDFVAMSKLESLTLSSKWITRKSIRTLGTIPANLSGLVLRRCAIDGPELMALLRKQRDSLTSLTLNHLALGNETIAAISRLEYLTWLDLTGATFSHCDLEDLRNLQQVRVLLLGGTNISESGLKRIARLNNVAMLDLANTKVGDAGIKHLLGMKRLETLIIRGTGITDDGVRLLRQGLPDLQKIVTGNQRED